MKAVIVGCGRVGAALAGELDRAGWQVLIIDLSTSAFDRLPSSFGGTARRGDGTDEDSLLQHGAADADLFLALTEGDNRNVMAAQLAIEALGARRCVAKINDPVRAEAYAHLGIAALCRTNLMTTAVLGYAGQATETKPGIYAPEQPHVHAGNDAQPSPGGQAATAGQTSPAQAATAGQAMTTGQPAAQGQAPATPALPGAGTPGSEG